MTRNDPNTGKFTQGNPGRPKGSKNVRTRCWEEVGELLVNEHAGRFADVLERASEGRGTVPAGLGVRPPEEEEGGGTRPLGLVQLAEAVTAP